MNLKPLANREKRLALALLRTLPVADVNGGSIVIALGERSAHGRVHAAAEQHNGAGFAGVWHS